MARVLTVAAIRKFRATGERRVIRDAAARSLYLVIQPSGAKSWMMRFRRPGGKAGKIVLGPVMLDAEVTGEPTVGMPLTLVGARQVAASVHRDRAMGRDPVADHKARKHRQRRAIAEHGANTFGTLARQFVEEHAKVKLRRWDEMARLLGLSRDLEPIPGGLVTRWADRDVGQIDSHDIHTVVDEARRVGVPGMAVHREGTSEAQARVMYAALSSMFGWCLKHRRLTANPVKGVWKPPSSPARDRVLTSAEVRAFWKATDAVGGPFGATLKLLLLTGCRVNEIAEMQWDELSDDLTQINLPASRTKNKRPHVVPLAPLAGDIISAMPRIDGSSFIFSTTGKTQIQGWSRIKHKLDAAMSVPPWRLHDLRRTFVTGLVELGVPPNVVELCVNHVGGVRAGVAGVYNRSEMLAERRAALERWAVHIQGLVTGRPARVVPIRARHDHA